MIKLDTSGQILWNNTDSIYFSRQNSHYTAGLDISPSGSIYVGGYVTANELEPRSQAFVIKYTPDGCSDTLCTTTSITEQIRQADQLIIMYPNPVKERLHIIIKEDVGPCLFQLSDLYGQIILTHKLHSIGMHDINLNTPPGFYIASFDNEYGVILTRNLVIQ